MPKPKTYKLRVLTFNTHVGLALYVGAISWLLARIPGLHLVALQEVQSPRARKKARQIFDSSRWWVAMSDGRDDNVGTVCFANRKRFDKRGQTQHKISDHHGRMHPRRDLISLTLKDKKTKRYIEFSSLHTWHIVGHQLGDKGVVSEGHIKQVRTYAIHHALSGQIDPESVQITAGDVNERLNKPPRGMPLKSAKVIFKRDAGMVPAYIHTRKGSRKVDVDDVFYKQAPFIKCLRRRVFKLPFKVVDHWAIYCVFEVEALDK